MPKITPKTQKMTQFLQFVFEVFPDFLRGGGLKIGKFRGRGRGVWIPPSFRGGGGGVRPPLPPIGIPSAFPSKHASASIFSWGLGPYVS